MTMKKCRSKTLGLLMVLAITRCCVQAQGIVYKSNLSGDSTGSYPVASDSWLATYFYTGINPDGYLLNSVQLAMLDGTGTPASFAVSLHSDVGLFGPAPGPSLAGLFGATDPQPAGTYTYLAPPNLLLLPSTGYHIVLSAGTALADGAYQWSTTSTSPVDPGNYWVGGYLGVSSDGLPSGWRYTRSYPQFALNATPIPEPSTLALVGLGGLFLFARAQPPLLPRLPVN